MVQLPIRGNAKRSVMETNEPRNGLPEVIQLNIYRISRDSRERRLTHRIAGSAGGLGAPSLTQASVKAAEYRPDPHDIKGKASDPMEFTPSLGAATKLSEWTSSGRSALAILLPARGDRGGSAHAAPVGLLARLLLSTGGKNSV